MRHIVLALMITLLPIRGWVGDAMAAQMMSGQMAMVSAMAAAPETPASQEAAAHEDCPGHASQAAAAEPEPQAPLHEACASCVTCQVCSSMALAAPDFGSQAHALPHVRPHAGSAAFASAEPSPALKPPIS